MTSHPVIGELKPDALSRAFNTGYAPFLCKAFKMDGLARVDGKHLQLLALRSHHTGRGHFQYFITECMAHYNKITLLNIMEGRLIGHLRHRGFTRNTTRPRGEQIAYTWTQQ